MATYFQRITGYAETVDAYRFLFEALDIARALGPAGAARAAALQAAIFEFERLENLVAKATAQRADAFIRTGIASTARRPLRPASKSGDMRGNVRSAPLASALPIGEVGIASIERLDKTVNPDFPRSGPYWRTQEYGYSGAVGRIVPGYFQPGQSAPSASQFRAHAYFEQVKPAPRGTPAMRITRPIPARHFLRNGTREAVAYWHNAQRRVERDVVAALTRL